MVLTHDPLGYIDSYNPYAYVMGDPINFWDPYGLGADQPNFAVPLDRIIAERQCGNDAVCMAAAAKQSEQAQAIRRKLEHERARNTIEPGHELQCRRMGAVPVCDEAGAQRIVETMGEVIDLANPIDPFPGVNKKTMEIVEAVSENADDFFRVFKIDSGVRRALAALTTQKSTIPAIIKREGHADVVIDLPIDALRSPKSEIAFDERFVKNNLEPARVGSSHLAKWTDASEREIAVQLECFSQLFPTHPTDYPGLLRTRKRVSV